MAGPTSVLYRTSATATGGRDGKVALEGGGLWLAMAIAKDMGGSGEGSNPEELFAMGYASCFSSALLFVGRAQKVDLSKAAITCKVGIGRNDTGGFALEATLQAHMPGIAPDQARALLEAAHQVCPYSNAPRGNMHVTLELI